MSTDATSSSRPSSPLTTALANAKEAGKTSLKPQHERRALGRDFQVLEPGAASNEAATHDQLTDRLKSLVAASTASDKLEKEKQITTILKLMFTRPPSPAQTVDSAKGERGDSKSSQRAASPASQKATEVTRVTSEVEKVLSLQEGRVKDENDLSLGQIQLMMGKSMINSILNFSKSVQKKSLPPEQQKAQKTQTELSTLAFLCEHAVLQHNKTSADTLLLQKTEELFASQKTVKKVFLTEDRYIQFELNPETTEGLAFLCKWAKLLSSDSSRFYIKDFAELAKYYEELCTVRSQSTGEIRDLANVFCVAIEWAHLYQKKLDSQRSCERALGVYTTVIGSMDAMEYLEKYGGDFDRHFNIDDISDLPTTHIQAVKKQEREHNSCLRNLQVNLKAYHRIYEAFRTFCAGTFDADAFRRNYSQSNFGSILDSTSSYLPTPDKLALMCRIEEYTLSNSSMEFDEKEPSLSKSQRKNARRKRSEANKKAQARERTNSEPALASPRARSSTESNESLSVSLSATETTQASESTPSQTSLESPRSEKPSHLKLNLPTSPTAKSGSDVSSPELDLNSPINSPAAVRVSAFSSSTCSSCV
jgi:hypothetical protein